MSTWPARSRWAAICAATSRFAGGLQGGGDGAVQVAPTGGADRHVGDLADLVVAEVVAVEAVLTDDPAAPQFIDGRDRSLLPATIAPTTSNVNAGRRPRPPRQLPPAGELIETALDDRLDPWRSARRVAGFVAAAGRRGRSAAISIRNSGLPSAAATSRSSRVGSSPPSSSVTNSAATVVRGAQRHLDHRVERVESPRSAPAGEAGWPVPPSAVPTTSSGLDDAPRTGRRIEQVQRVPVAPLHVVDRPAPAPGRARTQRPRDRLEHPPRVAFVSSFDGDRRRRRETPAAPGQLRSPHRFERAQRGPTHPSAACPRSVRTAHAPRPHRPRRRPSSPLARTPVRKSSTSRDLPIPGSPVTSTNCDVPPALTRHAAPAAPILRPGQPGRPLHRRAPPRRALPPGRLNACRRSLRTNATVAVSGTPNPRSNTAYTRGQGAPPAPVAGRAWISIKRRYVDSSKDRAAGAGHRTRQLVPHLARHALPTSAAKPPPPSPAAVPAPTGPVVVTALEQVGPYMSTAHAHPRRRPPPTNTGTSSNLSTSTSAVESAIHCTAGFRH